MKKRISLLVGLLAIAANVLADGFIIIHNPPHISRPIPHYEFAPLEVVYHHVNVKIDGQIATTTVDQEFYNPNDQRLEGTYLFPVPAGAQIDKFTMEINGKQVEAELLLADKARSIYEDIVRKMRDPALLEYAGRDVFKVRIFPIEPRSNKRVTLAYTQVLKADNGLVGYLYPLNTEKFSAAPIQDVRVTIELDGKRPLKTIYSPSHSVAIKRHGETGATIGFEGKVIRPDTDFQVFWQSADKDLGVSLLTYRERSDGSSSTTSTDPRPPAGGAGTTGTGCWGAAAAAVTGRKTRKTLPRPGALSTVRPPPCSRTIPRTTANPSPRPMNLLVKNGSKIFSMSQAVIPQPESVTSRQA